MLDLADDCSRFVTGYFEIISTSSPHIYHSALVLAPKASIVRKLYYESHSCPLVRVVRGLPVSWDPTAAAHSSRNVQAGWSPCSRFIAIIQEAATVVDILDSTTLQRLRTLKFPQDISPACVTPVFSPDGRTLTCSSGLGRDGHGSDRGVAITNWDLQTGGVASVIRGQKSNECAVVTFASITYSPCGKMVGVFYWHDKTHPSTLFIFDLVSGTHTHSHSLDGILFLQIWTHGESLRFATATGPETITVWEVGFTPGTTPTEVEILSQPSLVDDGSPSHIDCSNLRSTFHLIPAQSQLCIASAGRVQVWDGRASRFLLRHTDIKHNRMSFSSDDRFVACLTTESEIYIWKRSPTGYLLHGTLPSGAGGLIPLLSPNGESIIVLSDHMIQLLHTRDSTIPPSAASARAPEHAGDFALEFYHEGEFALAVRRETDVVMLLDLKSGLPPRTLKTSLKVYGLRTVRGVIVIIGDRRVIVGNLAEDSEDPWREILFDAGPRPESDVMIGASVSPDLRYICFVTRDSEGSPNFDMRSPQLLEESLRCTKTDEGIPWFLDDGRGAWKIIVDPDKGLGDSGCKLVEVDLKHPPDGSPWRSPRGYQTTDDGWVCGPDGKRLLMLPSLWRSHRALRQQWNGQFLALLHGRLPEPVILQLGP